METGAKVGMRDRSGGVLFLPLSFLVFLVLGAGDTQEGSDGEEDAEIREEAARQDGGKSFPDKHNAHVRQHVRYKMEKGK